MASASATLGAKSTFTTFLAVDVLPRSFYGANETSPACDLFPQTVVDTFTDPKLVDSIVAQTPDFYRREEFTPPHTSASGPIEPF